MTTAEFKQQILSDETVNTHDVNVVTTGIFGAVSCTYAVLSIPVAEKKRF